MLSHMLLWGVVAALLAPTHSHTSHWGRECPDIDPVPNLDTNRITGTWYVMYKFDTSNTCLVWNITKRSDETFTLTENRQFAALDAVSLDHTHWLSATLDTPNPEVPARMRVRWPTSLTGKADFTVFDTDYENFMAVFECDRAGFFHRRSVAVLSRTNVMDQALLERVRATLDKSKIPHGTLRIVNQEGCRDKGRFHLHTDGELFGLLPADVMTLEQRLAAGVEDYDVTELEILGDGVEAGVDGGFSGSLRAPKRKRSLQ